MADRTDDRRVRKTKKALRQGLVSLLSRKNLKDISVRELTDEADLHRGTFYVHYRDIYDLYDRTWREMLEEVKTIFLQHPPEELRASPGPLFQAIMEYAWENRDLCQMFFGPHGDQALVRELENVVEEKCVQDWPVLFPHRDTPDSEYLRIFMVDGCMGVVRRWVAQGMAKSPQEMAQLLDVLIKGVLGTVG